ncbi:MAG: DUF4097 family beta strand repeat protein [Bryobacterales bacterium]|nr:DUF4097 family beta strand repeat protein [Bryobacterales bacterium]
MKRRSLIAPLLLILAGALLLAWNLHPEWVSFRLIAMYWPFLLIAWGALRLIEIAYWRLTSKPLPARGISGGEWTLVVFICIFGSGLFFFHQRAPGLPRVFIGDRSMEIFGEAYDYPIEEVRRTEKAARIVVDNARGNLRVVGADTQEIKIGGRRTVRAYSRSAADDAVKKASLTVAVEGDHLAVRTTEQAGMRSDLRISTDLEMTVPRGAAIQATGRSGDFDIINIDGTVDLNSASGDVRLQDIGGNARVDLRRSNLVRAVNVKGNLDLLGRGEDVELENVSGTVNVNGYYTGDITGRNLAMPLVFQSGVTELRLGRVAGQFHLTPGDFRATNVAGPVRINARSKDVDLEQVQGEVTISVDTGDITLRPRRSPDAKIELSTRNGNVEISLPADARFDLDGTTQRGEASSEFQDAVRAATEGAGAALKGSTGKGARITIRTERGKIDLRKD